MNKIQQEAEKRYPTVSSRPIKKLVNEGNQEIFIAGATYERERSKVLVTCLNEILEQQEKDFIISSEVVKAVILSALKIYQNE
jgi:regulator of extracellular matrix RemA (YlzA/DUF370 family)